MGLWRARRRRAAYARLVAEASEHDVIWAAEVIVGGAWMAGLADAESQLATARQAPGSVIEARREKLREFAERERAAWEQAEWMRTLEVLADRDRLREARSRLAQPEQTAVRAVGRRP